MKKMFIVPVWHALLLFLLTLSACHKFIDWKDVWHKHKPDCRIEKIVAHNVYGFEDPLIAGFSYNQKGDPVLVAFNQVSTGRPHMRFYYDNKGRLTGYAGPYGTGATTSYEFYYVYQYDHKDRIVIDTFYGLGEIVDEIPIPNHQYKSYSNYEYDAFDRIIKVTLTAVVSIPYTVVEEYFYDSNGNRSRWRKTDYDGTVTEGNSGPYDDKKNLSLTSKVWMFIHRDYSRNNPYQAAHYNKAQLPTRYQLQFPRGAGFGYQFDISDSEIFYRCKK